MATPLIPALKNLKKHPGYLRASDVPSEFLVNSIQADGLLRKIAVMPDKDGTFVVVNGYLRVQALRRLGVTSLPQDMFRVVDAETAGGLIPNDSL